MTDSQTEFARANKLLDQADYKTALPLLESLVGDGHIPALIQLANCYIRGIGVEQNIDKALTLLEEAAERGSKEASNMRDLVLKIESQGFDRSYWQTFG